MYAHHARFEKYVRCEYTEIVDGDKLYDETSLCESNETNAERTEEDELEKNEIINIILIGKTGAGKSATGNTILKKKAFDVKNNLVSTTKYCQLECENENGTLIRVVDTPGVMDTDLPLKKTLKRIFHSMSLCPEGFSALLYAYQFGTKFTKEEIDTLILLKESFGENFIRDFCIVVMTRGDLFENDDEDGEVQTFEKWLDQQTGPPEFMALLEQCNKRVVLMYNKVKHLKEREDARNKLFDIIRSRPGRYTNEMFEKSAKQRKRKIMRLKLLHLEQYVQEKLSLIHGNIQKAHEYISEMKYLLDEIDGQARHDIVKGLIERGQRAAIALEDEIRRKEGGTDVANELIDKVNKIGVEMKDISTLCDEEKERRLKILEEKVKSLKNEKAKKLEKLFAVACSTVGAAVGGGIAGALMAAVGIATVSVLAPPIAAISGLGAGIGAYIYFKHFD